MNEIKEATKLMLNQFSPLIFLLTGMGVSMALVSRLIRFIPAPPPPAPAEWVSYTPEDEEEEEEGYTPPRKPHPGRYRFIGVKR